MPLIYNRESLETLRAKIWSTRPEVEQRVRVAILEKIQEYANSEYRKLFNSRHSYSPSIYMINRNSLLGLTLDGFDYTKISTITNELIREFTYDAGIQTYSCIVANRGDEVTIKLYIDSSGESDYKPLTDSEFRNKYKLTIFTPRLIQQEKENYIDRRKTLAAQEKELIEEVVYKFVNKYVEECKERNKFFKTRSLFTQEIMDKLDLKIVRGEYFHNTIQDACIEVSKKLNVHITSCFSKREKDGLYGIEIDPFTLTKWA